MDPDEALENARHALSAYLNAKKRREGRGDTPGNRVAERVAADELAEAFEVIDQWMTKGGFPPRGWTKLDPPELGMRNVAPPVVPEPPRDVYLTTRTVGNSFGTVCEVRERITGKWLAETAPYAYGPAGTAMAIERARNLAESHGWNIYAILPSEGT